MKLLISMNRLACLFYLFFFSALFISTKIYGQAKRIVIEIEGSVSDSNTYDLLIRDIDEAEFVDDAKSYKSTLLGKVQRCVLTSNKAAELLRISKLLSWKVAICPLEIDDSIRIKVGAKDLSFSGKGSEKIELCYRLANLCDSEMKYLSSNNLTVDSVGDFINYEKRFRNVLASQLALIDAYQGKITTFAYSYIKGYHLNYFRSKIMTKFYGLIQRRYLFHLDSNNLQDIYDSTAVKFRPGKEEENDLLNSAPRVAKAFEYYLRVEWWLKRGQFNSQITDSDRYKEYCILAKQMFKGYAQRKVLAGIIKDFIKKHMCPEAIVAANEFLKLPDFPYYSRYVKSILDYQLNLQNGKFAPSFTVTKSDGSSLGLDQLKGKVIILDFWFTGCKGCISMSESLRKLEERFRNSHNVVFLSISTDKNRSQWINSVMKGKYTTTTGIHAFTGGLGNNHTIIKDYNVTSYPSIFLIDRDGKIIGNNLDPREDGGLEIIALIKGVLPPSDVDGPYVLYKNQKIIVKSVQIEDARPVSKTEIYNIQEKPKIKIKIPLPEVRKSFQVELKRQLTIEKDEFAVPSQTLVISDIEGNFDSFYQLLLINGIIDTNYDWTFNDGHLVLLGDFFDRGTQVLEVLWLIYYLEEKAKQKGGYVHFILGNHEVMNLLGQLNYVHPKYIKNAALFGDDYVNILYGTNSELGKWLRTKNIIEKIGNILYVHGGISPYLTQKKVSLKEINETLRSLLGNKSEINNTEPILNTKVSPFWYRGYYTDTTLSSTDIDKVLSIYGAHRIVTGHTLVESGQKITIHFDNKVINTDTHHAEGYSEALLITRNNYFGINSRGNKRLLFADKVGIDQQSDD